VHRFYRRSGSFLFSFAVPNAYPHEPPKVKCLTKVYHPNIDLEGNVCLNILREDWKPVLTITSIVYGLNFLFLVRLKVLKLLFSFLGGRDGKAFFLSLINIIIFILVQLIFHPLFSRLLILMIL